MRALRALLGAVAVTALAAGCAGGSGDGSGDGGAAGGGAAKGGAAADVVSVGVIPIVDVAPLYLGRRQGFFADRDIELDLRPGQGGATIVPGVVSGELDFGFSNVTSLLLARGNGLPLTMVVAGDSTTGEVGADYGAVVVPEDSAITAPAGLAGATVAVNTLNNIGDTTIRNVVRQDGGDDTAVEFVELPFPEMPAALAQRRVDAAWVIEPFLTIATAQGARPVAWNYAATDPDLTVAAYFTSERLIAADPDLVDRFTAATQESLRYAQDNPDQARAVLGEYTDIDPATTRALTLPRWSTEIDVDSVRLLADLAVRDGLLESAPDLDGLLP